MAKNNKGFTLVELVVSIAIFGILSIAVMNFMTTGANLFSTVDTRLNLQYESQLAMAQLQEYIIDCNYSVMNRPTDNRIIVVNSEYRFEDDGTESTDASGSQIIDYTLHSFRYDDTDSTLYYSNGITQDATAVTTFASFSPEAVVAKDVDGFNITTVPIVVDDEDLDGDGNVDAPFNRVEELNFTLTLEKHGRNHVASQDIFLRNKPILAV